jgi:uncharacterized NAD(P)/FAD-binding protein YdhS
MLCQLVDKTQARCDSGQIDARVFDIAIFEKTDDFGPGFPHNGRFMMPYHITNMCAADMGVYADRPGDFQIWVNRNLARLMISFPTFPAEVFDPASSGSPCKHYPRAFMGEYLRTRFHQAMQTARQIGMTVTPYPLHEVTDVRPDGNTVRLVAQKITAGSRLNMCADAALLATGHWFPESRRTNFFDSPWPAAKLLESIPPGASVAVIGTSLSAIETVLTLTSDGHFRHQSEGRITYVPSRKPRKITLYSRRGLLPKVRGKKGSYRNQFLNASLFNHHGRQYHNLLTLKNTFRQLNLELESAYGGPFDWSQVLHPSDRPIKNLNRYIIEAENGDGPEGELIWQTVLSQTFPFIKDWYAGLTDHDRQAFDQKFTSIFFTHAATQPRINAAKLLALMQAKLVRVVKLGLDYRFEWDKPQSRYRFDYVDSEGNAKTDTYHYVVNARGQQKSLKTNPSRLAQNLIASGCVQLDIELGLQEKIKGSPARRELSQKIYPTGSLNIDPNSHRVFPFPSGSCGAGAVYAVGAMTRGKIINSSMAHGISMSTATIAENILNDVLQG